MCIANVYSSSLAFHTLHLSVCADLHCYSYICMIADICILSEHNCGVSHAAIGIDILHGCIRDTRMDILDKVLTSRIMLSSW